MYSLVIADDEQRICDSIQCVVETVFPQIKIAGVFQDGGQLEAYLKDHTVDMIITDIEMPQKTGLDIAKMIDAQGHPSYLIMITAYREFDYARQALESRVDSFLTKPYTTKILEDEIRKGIDVLAKKKNVSVEKWNLYRNLLKALSENEMQGQPLDGFQLCCGSAPFQALHCCEISINSENGNLLNAEQSECLIRDLESVGESDTPMQSVFFLEKRNSTLTFLAFFKENADTAFTESALQVVQQYTGDLPYCTPRYFDSFADFQKHRMFDREMDAFFKVFALNGVHHAESQASEFLLACRPSVRKEFARFLRTDYQANVNGDSVDEILTALSSLAGDSVGSRSSSYIVRAARDYIRNNYADAALSLNAAADALSVSTGYLSRVFKDQTGQNFSEYLQSVRMERAQQLLATTVIPTNAVAEQTGYSNSTYFRAAFKARFGLTPRQYRQTQSRNQ